MKIDDMIQVLQDYRDDKDVEFKHKKSAAWLRMPKDDEDNWFFETFDYRTVPALRRIWVSFHDDGPEAITLPPDAKDAEFYSEYIEYTDIVKEKLEI